jgi:hypothetical protein
LVQELLAGDHLAQFIVSIVEDLVWVEKRGVVELRNSKFNKLFLYQ